MRAASWSGTVILLFLTSSSFSNPQIHKEIISPSLLQSDGAMLEWGPNERVNNDPGSAEQWYPSLAVDEAGNAYAVWMDRRNGRLHDIFVDYRPAGGDWGSEVMVSDNTTVGFGPTIAVDGQGNAHVLWASGLHLYSVFLPAGGNWNPEDITIERVTDADAAPLPYTSLAVDPEGNAYAIWYDRRSPTGGDVFFDFRPAGGTWGTDTFVSDVPGTASPRGTGGAKRLALTVDQRGNAYAVWGDIRNGDREIFFAHRPSGGSWSANEPTPGPMGENPDIAVDGSGNAHVVWAGVDTDFNIYANIRSPDGTWSTPIKINDDTGLAHQNTPVIAVDDQGNAYAVWLDKRNSIFTDARDIFSSAYSPSDGTWSANVPVNDEPAARKLSPDVAVDGSGNAYAVWMDEREGNWDIYFSTTASVLPPAPVVDLSIQSVKPIQVVENADINSDGRIDLIQGKRLVVRVTVEVLNGDADDLVDVEVSYQGDAQVETHTVLRLQTAPVDFFLTPGVTGNFSINGSIDPTDQIDETNETNNETSVDVTVKDTRGLNVVYMPVEHLGPLSEYNSTVQNSNEFIKGVYPIAPAELMTPPTDKSFEPSPFNTPEYDLVWLWIQGKRISGDADRIVGVVPREYFEFHYGCVPAGLANRRTLLPLPPPLPRDLLGFWFPAVFVLEGHWTAAAHEIGHTYNLKHEFETIGEDPCTAERTGDGLRATGYWVERREPKDTLGFMGTAPGGPEGHSFDRWAEHSRFIQLFDQFRISQSDPEVLLVSGFVHPDGGTELAPLYRVEHGIIDEVASGDHTLQLLDPQGNIVQEISFGVASTLFIDPFPAIESDTGVFAFAISYPKDVQSLRILRNDVLVMDVVVTTQLLHDAVDATPDFGFTKNPSQRRNALHNKLDALETQIRNGGITGAVNKLQHDIRPTLDRWLVDDYQPENVLQYSRAEVLALVDEMIQRLAALE